MVEMIGWDESIQRMAHSRRKHLLRWKRPVGKRLEHLR